MYPITVLKCESDDEGKFKRERKNGKLTHNAKLTALVDEEHEAFREELCSASLCQHLHHRVFSWKLKVQVECEHKVHHQLKDLYQNEMI